MYGSTEQFFSSSATSKSILICRQPFSTFYRLSQQFSPRRVSFVGSALYFCAGSWGSIPGSANPSLLSWKKPEYLFSSENRWKGWMQVDCPRAQQSTKLCKSSCVEKLSRACWASERECAHLYARAKGSKTCARACGCVRARMHADEQATKAVIRVCGSLSLHLLPVPWPDGRQASQPTRG